MKFDDYCYLYVDDDPLSREVLLTLMNLLLRVSNITVFADSKDFLESVHNLACKPDLILLDIHVEPLNGFEMLKLLRSDDDFKNTKIIAVTASAISDEIEALTTSGFNGAISKPLSIELFPSLIERILKGESIWHLGD